MFLPLGVFDVSISILLSEAQYTSIYSSVLVNSVMANTAALTVIKAKKAWCSQGTVSKNINGRWTGGDNSIK